MVPFLESIVYDCLQHQSVSNVGGATKVEHVYAPQSWVSITQTTRGKSIQSIIVQNTNDFFTNLFLFDCSRIVTVHLAEMVATFSIQAMICPPKVLTW